MTNFYFLKKRVTGLFIYSKTINQTLKLSVCLCLCCCICMACNNNQLKVKDLELTDTTGIKIEIIDYKDKVLFVNFWATWCKPCLEEFPSITRAQKIMEPKGYQFLFISDESLSVINNFKKKKDYNFTYLKSNKAIAEYGIYSLPVTYIIANGKVLGTLSGGYRWDTPGNLKLLEDFLKQ